MQQVILIKDIEKAKMDALLNFLKTWDIEAELKTSRVVAKKKSEFTLSAGIWEDNNIDAKELRAKVWNRNK